MSQSSFSESSSISLWQKEKVGFWCPGDISAAIQKCIDEGRHQDKSKAIVALIREGLKSKAFLSDETQQSVEDLSRILERSPSNVLAQCVEGMITLIKSEGQEMPILFQEIQLRKMHLAKQSESKLGLGLFQKISAEGAAKIKRKKASNGNDHLRIAPSGPQQKQ